MAGQAEAEPTMEEILASIRRIISEDDLPAPKAAPEPAAPAKPLELSSPIDPDPIFAPEPAMDDFGDDLMVFDRDEPIVAAPEPAAIIRSAPAFQPANDDDTFLSNDAANAAASALGRLAGSIRIADTDGITLEAIVREMLRPMLKQWLDDNLPGIVESRVDAAVSEVMRRTR